MAFLIKTEITRNSQKIGLSVSLILLLIFAMFIGLAILFFPDKYNFFTSYLSELGVTTTIHGKANPISSMFFSFAMMFFGFFSAVFWSFCQNVLRFKIPLSTNFEKIIAIGSSIGFLSAIPSFLIGIVPFDYQNPIHITLAWLYFCLSGIACLSYSTFFIYQFFKNKTNNKILPEAIVSVLIPSIGVLIITLYNQKISILIDILAVVIFLLLNFILARRFKKLLPYISYIASFSLFPVGLYIVIALLFIGFTPEVEVIIILSLIIFLLAINLQLLSCNT